MADNAVRQAAFLLLVKASHVPQSNCRSTMCGHKGGGKTSCGPNSISTLCLQEQQCMDLNEELISNEGEA